MGLVPAAKKAVEASSTGIEENPIEME